VKGGDGGGGSPLVEPVAFCCWKAERWPQVSGFITEYVYRAAARPGEYVAAAVFESKEAMERHGRDPSEDRWYHQLRALLEADPEWEDGEIVFVY
jgi:quinol monooxygenase YgiN